MTNYLGVDVGTSTITAVVVDVDSGGVERAATVPNRSETTCVTDRGRGRSEWDAGRMADDAALAIGEAVAGAGPIEGIGVTGQQHGMLLVSDDGGPMGPFVGWQDRRGLDPAGGGGETYVDRMRRAAEEVGARGCRPTAGYLGTTLYWMAENGELPESSFIACFMPDFVVSSLTGTRPVTDPTDAAGSGLYDIHERQYHKGLVEALGLSCSWLPDVRSSASQAGELTGKHAELTGLPEGLPVTVACGDNQASFAGSVADYAESLLINIGTGGQLSVHVDRAESTESLEARPYVDGRFLLVGAGLVGGRSYAWLRDFFREVGRSFFGAAGDGDLYEAMNRLAAEIPDGADGLSCEPLFTGTRREPECRGTWSGVGTANFTPGHMGRALLEGLAAQFREHYEEMDGLGCGGRTKLVGSGNGVRKNRLLQEIIQDCFGMTISIPVHTEEAAYGAALLAAVGNGVFSGFDAAGKVIDYL